MTTYGITPEGFVLKRLPIIKTELEDDFRGSYGDSVNLDARTPEGQLIGIMSEREAELWEKMEQLYYSAYPDTAEGVPLDNSVAITGTKRRASTYSTVVARIIGVATTVVPNTFEASVENNPDAKFKLNDPVTIAAGVSEVQKIVYSAVPTSGIIAYVYDGNQTADLDFNATVGEIETALEALEGIDDVSITGDYTIGHTITFVGDSANTPFDILTVGSNSLDAGGAVGITITEETEGKYPEIEGEFTATTKGAVQAPTSSLIVIDTPINGVESIINDADATLGDETEEDAELKLRRETEIAQAGKATVDAIRASISEVLGVTSVLVFNNRTNNTDAFGRPPHSVDCVVEGGVNQDIADDIWDVIGAGITMYGDIEETVTDSNGFFQKVYFSRPTDVTIWVEVDLTTDTNFPVDGIALVEAAILAYGNDLEIGEDVIVYTPLINSFSHIEGITDVAIRVGVADFPVAGSGTFTASDSTGDLLATLASHGLSDDNRVKFSNSGGALPTGLSASTSYYIDVIDTNTFLVLDDRGGDPIAYTDAGTGTNTVTYGGFDDNIIIAQREKAGFDSARITAVEV